MGLRLFKCISSFIIGFSLGYLAIYISMTTSISPLILAIAAAGVTVMWGSFLSRLT